MRPGAILLSYCTVFIACVSFSVLAPLFYHFFDKQRCCNVRVKCMIGPCFLMSLLFSVHKKRCTIVPHDIGWFCCIYTDKNQLVIHESIDNFVIVDVNHEVGRTTTFWEPDIVMAVTMLPAAAAMAVTALPVVATVARLCIPAGLRRNPGKELGFRHFEKPECIPFLTGTITYLCTK